MVIRSMYGNLNIFVAALSELPIMCVAAFLLDTFIAGPLAKKNSIQTCKF